MNTDLTKLLLGYEGKWVALSADNKKVMGVGDNPREALEQAQINKEQNPVLTKVSQNHGSLILEV